MAAKPDAWKLYCEAFRALFPTPRVRPDGMVSPAALQEMVERLMAGERLTKAAQIGGTIFREGVDKRLVIERAQREFEYQQTPEKQAERMERVKALQRAVSQCAKHQDELLADITKDISLSVIQSGQDQVAAIREQTDALVAKLDEVRAELAAAPTNQETAERAEWLADKIPAYGDYAKEAAMLLRNFAWLLRRVPRVDIQLSREQQERALAALKTDPKLLALLEAARQRGPMSAEEIAAQRLSFAWGQALD